MTYILPWDHSKYRSEKWDVTVVSTFADSYLRAMSHSASGATKAASVRKVLKYSILCLLLDR